MWFRRRTPAPAPSGAAATPGSAADERPARGKHGEKHPSPWVERFAAAVPTGARVLDVACGRGRHARLFADQGCSVDAVDAEEAMAAALAGLPGIRFLCADLEAGPWPYPGRRFDAIIVTNYLHRPLFAQLIDALAEGGLLIYETFMVGNERFGKPTHPAFLLRSRELIEAFGARLTILAFEEGVVSLPRPARVSRICAVRAHGDAHLRIDAHR
jgi:SAM-dependent methyltransferase